MENKQNNFAKTFGPGLLLAGISVGTSHLVQSTRAGAGYGLSLVVLIIVAALIKYPAFRFGAMYAAATKESILQGYRRQGKWATPMYVIVAVGTMFAAVPAVTLFTAGLAQTVFGLQMETLTVCALILLLSCVMLILGGYAALDRAIKYVMVFLVLSTIVATVFIIPQIDWSSAGSFALPEITATNILFLAALVGWMPCSMDISVWYSLWSIAKSDATGHQPSVKESLLDFNIGYVGTITLALCFLLLGLGAMYGKGLEFAPSAAGFAEQLIGLYTQSLGVWSGPVIGLAAFLVMFSTVLTGMDGYPRVVVEIAGIFGQRSEIGGRQWYATSLIVLSLGSFLILTFFLTSLQVFIDVAATIAFLFGPIIATLNHRSIFSAHVPEAIQPGYFLRLSSWLGIFVLTAFALYYLHITY